LGIFAHISPHKYGLAAGGFYFPHYLPAGFGASTKYG
jgi:hypothetical protein